MQQINEAMTTLTLTSEDLAQEVHAKSKMLDDKKAKAWLADVGRWIADKVNKRFDQAMQEPLDTFRSEFETISKGMATLGAERLSEVRREVDTMLSEADSKIAEGVSYLNDARQDIEKIERRVTFVGISRLALAVLPLCTALILVGGLVWGLTSMVGIGPLFGWIWASFTAASLWWQKLLIALGGLGAAAVFGWIVLRVSQWVYENLR